MDQPLGIQVGAHPLEGKRQIPGFGQADGLVEIGQGLSHELAVGHRFLRNREVRRLVHEEALGVEESHGSVGQALDELRVHRVAREPLLREPAADGGFL